MENPITAKEQPTAAEKPYKRQMWISILLMVLLSPGSALIYCGNLKGGIILTLALIAFEFLLSILFAYSANLAMAIGLMVVAVATGLTVLIVIIKYTKKSNLLNVPRLPYVWIWVVFVFLIGFGLGKINDLIIKANFVEAYRVPSGSMENTLLVSDYLIATKGLNPDKLQRGDVIIFKYPLDKKINNIKRLVAVEGDTIRIVNKQLFVNHRAIPAAPQAQFIDSSNIMPYSPEKIDVHGENFGQRDNMPEQIIPQGKFFVLGDNRDNSADSRYWGLVDRSEVVGIARFIHFSWDSEHWEIRWDRIGRRLDDFKQPS